MYVLAEIYVIVSAAYQAMLRFVENRRTEVVCRLKSLSGCYVKIKYQGVLSVILATARARRAMSIHHQASSIMRSYHKLVQ